MSISAMKQALEAMESFSTGIFKGEFTSEIAALRQAIEQAEDAVLAEREACEKLCEDLIGTRAMARHCADAIRARGETK